MCTAAGNNAELRQLVAIAVAVATCGPESGQAFAIRALGRLLEDEFEGIGLLRSSRDMIWPFLAKHFSPNLPTIAASI